MTTPTRTELLERIKANPRFREVKPGESVVIVGVPMVKAISAPRPGSRTWITARR